MWGIIRRKLAEMGLLTLSHSLTQDCIKLHSLCYSFLVWEVFSHFRSQEAMLLLISPAHLDLGWLRTQRPGKVGTKVKMCDSQTERIWFSSVQLLSRVRLLATPWIAARQASLSITNSQSLPKLMTIQLVMPSNHFILCCPLLFLPSIFPNIRIFSNESALHSRWPNYWSFSFNISPSNEHPGLISFRMDWLDLLEVQGTLKSLLQHHSSKASILLHSAFFIVQLSRPYKTIYNNTPNWL